MNKRISVRVLCCSAPVLFMSAALLAQAPGGAQPSMPQQQQTPSTQSMPSTADSPAQQQGGAQSYADQAFVKKAMEGGAAEVQLGQLAQQKSQSSDVKQFGARMVNDHGQMGEKWFKPVAKQLGVSEPSGPSKKDKKLIESLQALSGPQFDTAYIQAMVKDHKEDLKDFQGEAQTAQDPSVKQIAEKGSTIIQQHLQMIEQIAQAHNVTAEVSSK